MGYPASDPPWGDDPTRDPGWRPVLRQLPFIVVPQLSLARARRGGHGVMLLRVVYASFVWALLAFGMVLPFVVTPLRHGYTLTAVLLGASSLICYGVEPRIEKPLRCGSRVELANSYRTRFFLRIAFGEAIALFGFVATFVDGHLVSYYVGLVLVAPAFVRAAPGVGAFQREQDALTAQGCGESLVAALRSTPPAPRRHPYT